MKITKRQLTRIIKEEKRRLINENSLPTNAERMQGTYSSVDMIDAVTDSIQALLTQTESDAYEDLGDNEDAAMAAEDAITLTIAQAFQHVGLTTQYETLIRTLR